MIKQKLPMQIQQWLKQANIELKSSSPSPDYDCQIILECILDRPASYLKTWPEKELTDQQRQQANHWLERRKQGEPIAYIIGFREFWTLRLACNRSTLIPRADTECLVEYVLEQYAETNQLSLLDLGTGTGAIALSLKSEQPHWQVFAMDYHFAACQLAQSNNVQQPQQVAIFNGDWLSAIQPSSLDIIISNPPYIESDDPHLSRGDLRFEPSSALTAGTDGLKDIITICQQSFSCLKDGGELIIEHGYNQKHAVQAIFKQFNYSSINTLQDYAGNDRFTVGKKKPA